MGVSYPDGKSETQKAVIAEGRSTAVFFRYSSGGQQELAAVYKVGGTDMVLSGFDDLYLPSREELARMYQQRALIGGLKGYYWSSSEDSLENAWNLTFTNGYQYSTSKSWYHAVRAIRAF